jgi:hypothetical protein
MALASGQREHTPESANIQSANAAPLHSRPAWALLSQQYQKLKRVRLRQLFADAPERGERLTGENLTVRALAKSQQSCSPQQISDRWMTTRTS